MKIKLLNILLLITGSGLFFASCNSDEDVGDDSSPVAVQFGSGITQTKTTNGGNNWVLNDPVGIFMIKNGQALNSANIAEGADNIEYKALADGNATSQFTPASSTPIYYPQNGNKVDFIAYYPYKTTLPNYIYPVDVNNQTSPADIDILYAKTANTASSGYNKNSGTVDLQFNHVLSKLSFTLISGTGSPNLTGAKIEIANLFTTANMSLADGTVTATNSRQTLIANTATDGLSSSAIVIPQMLSGTKLIVTLADNVSAFEWVFTSAEFEKEKDHQYTITVSKTGITVSSSGITTWIGTGDAPTAGTAQKIKYQVGDYYPYPDDPKSAIGVVFEITDGVGYHGKIVSMDEAINVSWGNPAGDEQAAGVASIRDQNDGQAGTKNLISKYKHLSTFATVFEAFNWIYQTKNKSDVNGRWYMPAKNELISFYNVWNADRSGFSAKLTAAGYGEIWGDCYYWSSTEFDTQYTYFIRMTIGTVYNNWYDKAYSDHSFRVRAVSKF